MISSRIQIPRNGNDLGGGDEAVRGSFKMGEIIYSLIYFLNIIKFNFFKIYKNNYFIHFLFTHLDYGFYSLFLLWPN